MEEKRRKHGLHTSTPPLFMNIMEKAQKIKNMTKLANLIFCPFFLMIPLSSLIDYDAVIYWLKLYVFFATPNIL